MIYGFDFGTTNSLISRIRTDGKVQDYPDDDGRPIPSIVSYTSGGEVLVGKKAKAILDGVGLGVIGNTVRSPKTLLGRELIPIAGDERDPVDIAKEVIKKVKEVAELTESQAGSSLGPINKVVATIPVSMDGHRRAELRKAFSKADINVVQFVHEPFAALYGYFRSLENMENEIRRLDGRHVLVVDWGGGTLDLTLCLIKNGGIFQVKIGGSEEVGGDIFDRVIREELLKNFRNSRKMSADVITPDDAKRIFLQDVEDAKIKLSRTQSVPLYRKDMFVSDGSDVFASSENGFLAFELESFTQAEMNQITRHLVALGIRKVQELCDDAGINPSQVALVLGVGGMASMQSIRDELSIMFSAEKFKVPENSDRLISYGAAWIANDRAPLVLSKPIEVQLPRGKYFPMFKAGTQIPFNLEHALKDSVDLFCSDPSDGKAKIPIATPQTIPIGDANFGERENLAYLSVKISSNIPLHERIHLSYSLDRDLILKVEARSKRQIDLMDTSDSANIFMIDFGISLPGSTSGIFEGQPKISQGLEKGISLISNVTNNKHDEESIPGDVLPIYNSHAFDASTTLATEEQKKEHLAYKRCPFCTKYKTDCVCNK